MHAEAGRTLGVAVLGKLPWSNLTALEQLQVPGWNPTNGLVKVSSFTDTAVAELGTGTSAPPASATVGGSLTYYTGSGYSTKSITTSKQTITVPPVCIYDLAFAGGPLLITMGSSPSVPANATSCASANPGAMTFTSGGASASSATCAPGPGTCQATSDGPLNGTFYYTVAQNSQSVAQLQVNVTFGQLIAKATYSPG